MMPIPYTGLETSRGSRGRNGCQTCRRRHLKCDEARPTCFNCSKASRECVWLHKLKIRHDERSSANDAGPGDATHQKTRYLEANLEIGTKSRGLETPETSKTPPWRFCFSPRQLFRQYIGVPGTSSVFDGSIQTGAHGKSTTELLAQPHEAMLFKTYIDYCGPWLDITTPTRQFALTVPRLALSNPTLLYACLAYASKTVSPNTSLCEEYAALCIAQLIPLLSDANFIKNNDGLLATLVILRHVEQYAKFAEDTGAHLLGAYGLVEIRKEPYRHNSLPCSAFWTFMRQDLRRALLSSSAPLTPARGMPIEDFAPDEGVPDNAWADRACHLATQAAAFAWGPAHDIDANDLDSQLEDWKRSLPEAYHPYSVIEDALHFFADWHAVGWQFYHLAKILLDLYNSECPKNMSILTFCAQVETQILYHVRTLCTITYAFTNLGCHFNSTAILGFVGSFLRDEGEQARLIEYLKYVASETGWPTEDSQSKLLHEWSQPTASTRSVRVTRSTE